MGWFPPTLFIPLFKSQWQRKKQSFMGLTPGGVWAKGDGLIDVAALYQLLGVWGVLRVEGWLIRISERIPHFWLVAWYFLFF
jgi:hypothetical protein